jgi:multidrug efflux system membrane fusion protein
MSLLVIQAMGKARRHTVRLLADRREAKPAGAIRVPKTVAGRMAACAMRMILGVACIILICGCERKTPAAMERPPAPVTVATAVTQDVPIYLDGIGKTVASEVVSVLPQVSGPITAIRFADGADLRAGDALFIIDPRPFEAALHQAEANLGRDRAQLQQAEANLARDAAQLDNAAAQERRYKALIEDGAVSSELYDQVRTAARAAEATIQADRAAISNAEAGIRADQAAVESARIQLGYTSIRSPIGGRAGQRLVDLGNVVTANSTALLTIQRLDPIYADFTIPESDLTAVQGNAARGSLRVEVRIPDSPDEAREGKLTFLDNAVQDATGTLKLRATIGNGDHRFWPGRFVKIRLVLSTIREAVMVPAAAPQLSAKGPFVYVVKEDSTAELRPVTLGQRQGDLVVVTQGLRTGERVVVSGQLGVTPGGKIHIAEPRAAGNSFDANGGGRS